MLTPHILYVLITVFILDSFLVADCSLGSVLCVSLMCCRADKADLIIIIIMLCICIVCDLSSRMMNLDCVSTPIKGMFTGYVVFFCCFFLIRSDMLDT